MRSGMWIGIAKPGVRNAETGTENGTPRPRDGEVFGGVYGRDALCTLTLDGSSRSIRLLLLSLFCLPTAPCLSFSLFLVHSLDG